MTYDDAVPENWPSSAISEPGERGQGGSPRTLLKLSNNNRTRRHVRYRIAPHTLACCELVIHLDVAKLSSGKLGNLSFDLILFSFLLCSISICFVSERGQNTRHPRYRLFIILLLKTSFTSFENVLRFTFKYF